MVAALLSLAFVTQGASRALAAEPAHGGAALYKKYCQPCHGADLEGYAADNAPSLVSPTFRASASDEFLHIAIGRGRAGTAMAGYAKELGGPLTDIEIDTLIEYIRGGTNPVPLPEQHRSGSRGYGERLYHAYCESCHGTEQTRGNAVHLANPMFLDSATDPFLRVAIEEGRPGTPMEAWQDKLKPQEISDLVAYLRSLARPVPAPPAVAAPAIDGTRIVLHPDGAPAILKVRDDEYVPVAELFRAYDAEKRMVIIDARPRSDYLRSHIEGAIWIPYFDLKDLDKIPNDGTWVVVYCACPHHLSQIVFDELRKRGYKNSAVLDEGVFEWQRFGHPMTIAPGQLPVAGPPR